MKITYNQILSQLNSFFDSHYQVEEFRNGNLWEALETNSFNDALYPLAFLVDAGANTQQGKVGLTFDLLVMDLVDKDEANENEVKSDTLQIILDTISYLEQLRDGNWYNVQIEKSANAQSFTESLQDELTGWKITLTLTQSFSYNACEIPYSGVSNVDTNCLPVIVKNTEETTLSEIASGGTYVVPDSEITFNGGAYASLPATTPLNVRVVNEDDEEIGNISVGTTIEIENISIYNEDSSFTDEAVVSEDGYQTPNINFTDSDLTTTSIPSCIDIVATPCALTPCLFTDFLYLNLDARNLNSYSGTGVDWKDTTTNYFDFILENGVSYSSLFGGLLRFDGINQRAIRNNSDLILGVSDEVFTIDTVFKLDSTGTSSYPNIASFRHQYGAFLILSSEVGGYEGLVFGTRSGTVKLKTTTLIAKDVWNYASITYNGGPRTSASSWSVKINGVAQALSSAGAFALTSGTASYIGNHSTNGPSSAFKGDIAPVRIYKKVLTTAEQDENLAYYDNIYNLGN
jgi:hypothetical protein